MAARSTRGVKVCIVEGAAVGSQLTPTAVSSAKPAVVSLASTTSLAQGNVISIPSGGTGYPEIDGKGWVIGEITAQGVSLLGSDTTNSAGVLASVPTMTVYSEAEMECLCLASLEFAPEEADNISVGTFCDPTATIPGAVVGAGTMDFTGYVDVNASDYRELLAAFDDGNARIFRIFLPNNGYLVFPATMSSFNIDVPLEGAIGYNGTFSLGSRPRHLF